MADNSDDRINMYGEILSEYYRQMAAQNQQQRANYSQDAFDAKYYARNKADTFRAPPRQRYGPGWICAHCHFANEVSPIMTAKCGDCRIAR